MPIMDIRCSKNIGTTAQLNDFINEVHQQVAVLVSSKPEKFKSFVVFFDHLISGVKEPNTDTYINITLKFLPRPKAVRQQTADLIYQLAEKHFRLTEDACQIFVEVLDIGNHKLG